MYLFIKEGNLQTSLVNLYRETEKKRIIENPYFQKTSEGLWVTLVLFCGENTDGNTDDRQQSIKLQITIV